MSVALQLHGSFDGLTTDAVERFIVRWDGTGMAERANYSAFLHELCDVLDVPRPNAAIGSGGDYRLERAVKRHDDGGGTSSKRIDLYKRGCFVLEAKQGAAPARKDAPFELTNDNQRRANIRNTPEWARYMQQAKGQAERYARDVLPEEGWPPFLIVCDIGYCFDLYFDFSGTGKHYAQFPDFQRFRIYLPDLRKPDVRELLRQVWLDPKSLDPALRRAQVTRDIAALLAKLAAALEGLPSRPRHAPEHVATFLMRCIFCMFAQSVGLLPQAGFTKLLERCRANPVAFLPLVGDLWATMDAGGFSIALEQAVFRFNGGLFRPGAHGGAEPLPVNRAEIAWLLEAASKDWAEVEPAIFGTLLENALDAKERSRLGAQFTPRAFVERLVLPTVMEPLREEWDGVRGAAEGAMRAGNIPAAAAFVRAFHGRLCAVRVLDPACGSGNFLYVTLELMKRLEGEVLDALDGFAPNQAGRMEVAGATVDPHQFYGLDVNPRAVRSRNWCCGSATCNGTSAPTAGRRRPSRSFAISAPSKRPTRCWRMTAWNSTGIRPDVPSHYGAGAPSCIRARARRCRMRPIRLRGCAIWAAGKQPGRRRTSSWATRRSWRARTCGRSWDRAMPRRCGRRIQRCRGRLTWRCSSGGVRLRHCGRAGRSGSALLRATAFGRCFVVG